MPIHMHPVFRQLETALESEGLIVTLDSAGYTVLVAQESAGVRPPKPVPPGYAWITRGTKHTAS